LARGRCNAAGDYPERISTLPPQNVIITSADRYKNYILDHC
jgi:hypothetical protein